MTKWAASSGIKVEWAKKNIRDLETQIIAFHKSEPYTVVSEDDADTGDLLFRILIRDSMPPYWGCIAGDAIHNLRASLDILWRQAIGAKPGTRRKESFFSADAKRFKNTRGRGEIKGREKKAVEVLKAFKPYDGGDEILWSLNVADSEDKHRALIPVYFATEPILFQNIAALSNTMRPPGWGFPVPWFLGLQGEAIRVENGAIIGRCPAAHRAEMQVKAEFTLTVAFGESEILEGKPIIPTLDGFAGKVDSVVEAFTRAGLLT